MVPVVLTTPRLYWPELEWLDSNLGVQFPVTSTLGCLTRSLLPLQTLTAHSLLFHVIYHWPPSLKLCLPHPFHPVVDDFRIHECSSVLLSTSSCESSWEPCLPITGMLQQVAWVPLLFHFIIASGLTLQSINNWWDKWCHSSTIHKGKVAPTTLAS